MPEKNGIRNYKRVPVKLETGIVSEGTRYTGFIENVSEHGLNLIAFSAEGIPAFIPGASLELQFQPSGGQINLNCEIQRIEISRGSEQNLVYTIAVEIKDPPPEYRKFFKTLK